MARTKKTPKEVVLSVEKHLEIVLLKLILLENKEDSSLMVLLYFHPYGTNWVLSSPQRMLIINIGFFIMDLLEMLGKTKEILRNGG